MMGTQILNYEIKAVLGGGGMGTVYLGEHVKLGRKVAIKVLLPHFMRNELVKSRFINEAKLMSTLHHPNIVTLYDYHEDEHGLSLIMEWAEGIPLDQYIKEVTGPIQEKDAILLMSQALNGFEYAHKQGLIHRDIKPSNLIVTQSKQIKILDFGIAKLVGELGNKLTKTGSHIGTVYYMSPEQVRGQETDVRSDVYALGVTFYQMLTGCCPYEGLTTEFDVFNKIVGEELPDPRILYPGISEHMCNVVQKATLKNPDDRFQTCEEFKEALQNDEFKYRETEEPQDVLAASVDPTTNVNDQLTGQHRVHKSREKKTKRLILYSLIGFVFLPIVIIIFLNIFSKGESNDLLRSKSTIAESNNDLINKAQKRLLKEFEKLEKEIEKQPSLRAQFKEKIGLSDTDWYELFSHTDKSTGKVVHDDESRNFYLNFMSGEMNGQFTKMKANGKQEVAIGYLKEANRVGKELAYLLYDGKQGAFTGSSEEYNNKLNTLMQQFQGYAALGKKATVVSGVKPGQSYETAFIADKKPLKALPESEDRVVFTAPKNGESAGKFTTIKEHRMNSDEVQRGKDYYGNQKVERSLDWLDMAKLVLGAGSGNMASAAASVVKDHGVAVDIAENVGYRSMMHEFNRRPPEVKASTNYLISNWAAKATDLEKPDRLTHFGGRILSPNV